MSPSPGRRFVVPERAPRIRANERIRVPEVRVINETGEQIGVMRTAEALSYARERGLDLVEVSPNTRPPVCRVMDLGKYKYEQSKRTRAAKKKQHAGQVKEVKLRPKIDAHDFDVKVANARKFLSQHHKVKLTIMFRGREMAHRERGVALIDRVVEALGELGQVEHAPRLEGRNLSTVVSPRSAKGRARAKTEAGGATGRAGEGETSAETRVASPASGQGGESGDSG